LSSPASREVEYDGRQKTVWISSMCGMKPHPAEKSSFQPFSLIQGKNSFLRSEMYRSLFMEPSIAKRSDFELFLIAPQNIIFGMNFTLPTFGRFSFLCQTPLWSHPCSIYVSSETNTLASCLSCGLYTTSLCSYYAVLQRRTTFGFPNLIPMSLKIFHCSCRNGFFA
jgi:hypothetical protein